MEKIMKREIVHMTSFKKAIEGFQPVDPDEVDAAIVAIKKAYHTVCGLPASEAAVAADKLSATYHGAKATEQAKIARDILGVASVLMDLKKQRTSSNEDVLYF